MKRNYPINQASLDLVHLMEEASLSRLEIIVGTSLSCLVCKLQYFIVTSIQLGFVINY